MNIHIERQVAHADRRGFADYTLPIFTHRFGVVSVLLFVTLVATESYYRNALHKDKVLYLGGLGSLIGFCVLFRAVLAANASWKRYTNRPACEPDFRSYVTLTDDYVEKGVAGLWHQRFNWRLLTRFQEHASRFLLEMEVAQIVIEKADLKSEDLSAEIRAFLTSKLSKVGAQHDVPPKRDERI
ncbi:MAG: hypothetical protein KA236_13685 [Verrucomicrobia bacterium]|jgi:hypothetical protein|nr:hypothetical protein [Verrucomicrobiota bacterium]